MNEARERWALAQTSLKCESDWMELLSQRRTPVHLSKIEAKASISVLWIACDPDRC
jgi:hypothetical protein